MRATLSGDETSIAFTLSFAELSGPPGAAHVHFGPAGQGMPPAPAGQFGDVVRAIKTGNAYANIHTEKFAAGEIRGHHRLRDVRGRRGLRAAAGTTRNGRPSGVRHTLRNSAS